MTRRHLPEVRVLKISTLAARIDALDSGRFRPWVWRCLRPSCIVFGLDHHHQLWADAFDSAVRHARLHSLDQDHRLDAHRTRTNRLVFHQPTVDAERDAPDGHG
ncbi:hypothetical protein [Curtobacterium oceanosedimentum]|uniref:hypothetical protein n=1 Tax=Curtobacterium oceanosedimentum TaxID=465820 RepID=UPI00339A4F10